MNKPNLLTRATAAVLVAFTVALDALTFTAPAQTPVDNYVTKSDFSTSTNWAEVVFPGTPERQIVLKQFTAQVANPTNQIDILSGTLPMSVWYSLNSTQLVVASNSFVTTNIWGILQFPGSNTAFVVNVLYTNQLTNIFIGGPGAVLAAAYQSALLAGITNTNCIFWACTNRTRRWTAVGSQSEAGEAIHAAQVRAPLAIRVGSGSGPLNDGSAAGVSNQVRSATVFYRPPN